MDNDQVSKVASDVASSGSSIAGFIKDHWMMIAAGVAIVAIVGFFVWKKYGHKLKKGGDTTKGGDAAAPATIESPKVEAKAGPKVTRIKPSGGPDK